MQSLHTLRKTNKIGKESNLHVLLKLSAESELQRIGYDTSLEEKTVGSCRVDVLGKNDSGHLVVECETLPNLRERISSTIQKACIKYGNVKLIFCLPYFGNLGEIWAVKEDGSIERFIKGQGGEKNG
jgi:hypothetical protein